jgi:tRNA uridine 5-carbamoylmethylation protein Kti12
MCNFYRIFENLKENEQMQKSREMVQIWKKTSTLLSANLQWILKQTFDQSMQNYLNQFLFHHHEPLVEMKNNKNRWEWRYVVTDVHRTLNDSIPSCCNVISILVAPASREFLFVFNRTCERVITIRCICSLSLSLLLLYQFLYCRN